MRMWMVDPRIMCRQHLLGEHSDIHKHRPSFVKQHSITKRVELGQIEPESMKVRHDQLVEEMLRRGYNHESPYEMPDLSYLHDKERYAVVDTDLSLADLTNRCILCRARNLTLDLME